jgi:hypothetical protein
MVKGEQNAFSTNDFMDIVCNADMHVLGDPAVLQTAG